MIAVYRKELKSYFCNMTGVIFIAWMLAWVGFYVRYYHLQNYSTNFEYVCVTSSFFAFLIIPILTMRSFAEEKNAKTDQLLYSLPMSTTGIVAGKYLATVTVLAIPTLVIAIYPLLLSAHGPIALVPAYGTLFAMFLLGCALIAICMFISSLTESQIIAAVMSFGALIALYMMTDWATSMSASADQSLLALIAACVVVGVITYLLTKNLWVSAALSAILSGATVIFYAIDETKFVGLVPTLMSKLAVFNRMVNFAYGLIDLTAIVYYISICGLFFFFAVQSLEKKRWS